MKDPVERMREALAQAEGQGMEAVFAGAAVFGCVSELLDVVEEARSDGEHPVASCRICDCQWWTDAPDLAPPELDTHPKHYVGCPVERFYGAVAEVMKKETG